MKDESSHLIKSIASASLYIASAIIRSTTLSLISLLSRTGWTFDFPSAQREGIANDQLNEAADAALTDDESWYVTSSDLDFFRYHAEGSGATSGASPWEVLMEKEIPNVLRYTAWRRLLPSGKTEYKSISVGPDATAEEFMDLYLDDDVRPSWDTLISDHAVLEHGNFERREQVVRWTRKFPFSFLSDREYCIARRMFKKEGEDGKYDLYGISKAINHPRAPPTKAVKMDVFYSMWRSRTVECPWGLGKPAVETLLLHHEQFKIPENLARFAVRHGMWGFVRNMTQAVPSFVAARRSKGVPSTSPDPSAYGAGHEPNPPEGRRHRLQQLSSSTGNANANANSMSNGRRSFSSSSISQGSHCEDNGASSTYRQMRGLMIDDPVGPLGGQPWRKSYCGTPQVPTKSPQAPAKLRGLAAFAIASTVALIARRTSSGLSAHGDSGSRLNRSASYALPPSASKAKKGRGMTHHQSIAELKTMVETDE